MSELLTNLSWWAVIVSVVVSSGFGALWYSTKMFGEKWAEGNKLTAADMNEPMTIPMTFQIITTILLAILVGVVAKTGAAGTIVIITLAMISLIVSNGKWAGKSNYTIMTDVGFVGIMIIIMVIVQTLMG